MVKGQVFEVLLDATGGNDSGLELPCLKTLAEFAPGVILQHNFPVISHSGPPLVCDQCPRSIDRVPKNSIPIHLGKRNTKFGSPTQAARGTTGQDPR